MTALKGCPFCGGPALLTSVVVARGMKHRISCRRKGCVRIYRADRTKLVAFWNKRAEINQDRETS